MLKKPKQRKKRKKIMFAAKLDFLLTERCPEGFAAALAQTDCKFCSLSRFVGLASQLPSFFRCYFFSTFGTFCQEFASMNVITELMSGTTDKTLLTCD